MGISKVCAHKNAKKNGEKEPKEIYILKNFIFHSVLPRFLDKPMYISKLKKEESSWVCTFQIAVQQISLTQISMFFFISNKTQSSTF